MYDLDDLTYNIKGHRNTLSCQSVHEVWSGFSIEANVQIKKMNLQTKINFSLK